MARLKLHVTPGAREEEIIGWRGDSLRIKVRARPEKGRANEAALRLLSGYIGLPRSNLAIVRGTASRDKLVEVDALSDEELQSILGSAARQRPSPGARSRRGRGPR